MFARLDLKNDGRPRGTLSIPVEDGSHSFLILSGGMSAGLMVDGLRSTSTPKLRHPARPLRKLDSSPSFSSLLLHYAPVRQPGETLWSIATPFSDLHLKVSFSVRKSGFHLWPIAVILAPGRM